jgi:hypothetical protein
LQYLAGASRTRVLAGFCERCGQAFGLGWQMDKPNLEAITVWLAP